MMKFVFADSLDFIDPDYDFAADRSGAGRAVHRDDLYPHEFLDETPYDGILVSRGIVGDARITGKYTAPQLMRFRREGARRFLRYPREQFPGSMMMGDCGAFSYRDLAEPPYRPEDTIEFYADAGFTHGCSVDHLIFDFDEAPGRTKDEITRQVRDRYEITLELATEFLGRARRLGPTFTPMGVVQGWSAQSMADAAAALAKMGYNYLAVGGLVPLRIDQIHHALTAIRGAVPPHVQLHLLGFAKIEHLPNLAQYGVASFDTTSPLLRAFKDARKNYFARDPGGQLSHYTAIRIPQAIENNKLRHKALEGELNQEQILELEVAALSAVRRFANREVGTQEALDHVMDYWSILNWHNDASPARKIEAIERQRRLYERTLADRPWEDCDCRVCREGGVEALIFRSSNRNKRRGIHNLYVFYRYLRELRSDPA
ncbi:MAG TPA: tRNA-guanine transglycosylase DpdA [Stellaceae bacterium]|nr:tRNA-guanine transglycosylase DpdA [Stellaceae bacterium]